MLLCLFLLLSSRLPLSFSLPGIVLLTGVVVTAWASTIGFFFRATFCVVYMLPCILFCSTPPFPPLLLRTSSTPISVVCDPWAYFSVLSCDLLLLFLLAGTLCWCFQGWHSSKARPRGLSFCIMFWQKSFPWFVHACSCIPRLHSFP